MVTITGYKTRATPNGDRSIYLIVEGGMQPAVSKTTGRTYFKSRKASVFAAIDEEVAKIELMWLPRRHLHSARAC